jgi:alpha-D-xyloside xylohydrolase
MRKILLFLASIIVVLATIQCSSDKGKVTTILNGVTLETKKLNLKVQFYSDNTVRVEKWLPGIRQHDTSLVVVANNIPEMKIDIRPDDEKIILSSVMLKVQINRSTGDVKFFTLKDSLILQEKGTEIFPNKDLTQEKACSVKQLFSISAQEGIYGLGQHQNGYMNYRGRQVKLVQSNTEAVSPFLISTRPYGILWDNYSKTIFNDDQLGMSMWSDVADRIDYYFIAGNNMDDVISGYRDLTGKAPMYGKWAYGYWQSKEHYENRAELLSIAKEYRQRRIPIDNIIQDWDTWEGQQNWNQLFFDSIKFPQPKEMIDILHKMNFHVMVSDWCSFGPNTAVYKDMQQKGFLYPTVGWAKFKYFDVYNPAANLLYWDYLNKGFFSIGMDAWWMDSTEPDVINANTKEATEYELKRMANNHLGSFARYLNTYSLLATENVYRNQRKTNDKKRVFILTRSTFAGQQRAAATTWSGDIGASWDVYKKQITAGINHSMSGIPYWTFDIGAFVLAGYNGVFDKGGSDRAYHELYTRMFQFGTFCPIFRSHGSETPREIWRFGDFSKVLVKFDNLRYRLMPYIYSMAYQVTQNNYTMMRGLPMDFPEDKKTYNINDQYMFGPSILVCPVTEYMINRPPGSSVRITPDHFRTPDGKPGIQVRYYKDDKHQKVSLEKTDSCICVNYYATGRPDYVTDSTLSIDWNGKIIAAETGTYQFHIKCYGPARITLNGKDLKFTYQGVEAYTEKVELKAGNAYDIAVAKENSTPGAFHVELFWKTPSIFARESGREIRKQTRQVYLPAGSGWYDFWTGVGLKGGQTLDADAPIDKIPLYIKAGSIIPMGPFIQYSNEKPADPLEIRVYAGENGSFNLYEDEGDNYNYEKGAYALIPFMWDDAKHQLTIGRRQGAFPGMLTKRSIHIIVVNTTRGGGMDLTSSPDKTLTYTGEEIIVKL